MYWCNRLNYWLTCQSNFGAGHAELIEPDRTTLPKSILSDLYLQSTWVWSSRHLHNPLWWFLLQICLVPRTFSRFLFHALFHLLRKYCTMAVWACQNACNVHNESRRHHNLLVCWNQTSKRMLVRQAWSVGHVQKHSFPVRISKCKQRHNCIRNEIIALTGINTKYIILPWCTILQS